jgi:hypothetical protein
LRASRTYGELQGHMDSFKDIWRASRTYLELQGHMDIQRAEKKI